MRLWSGLLAVVLVWSALTPARAETVCTLVIEAASGALLQESGDCESRVTPASTFKIPLAVMGFDSGLLTDAQAPVMTIEPGDPDWGGDAWRQPTNPVHWMRFSVLWYSQRLTRTLGAGDLTRYAQAFGYGNADFTGDPGFDNGLERSWIASSLRVSPREQAGFLRGLVLDALPVRAEAMAAARGLLEAQEVGGWVLRGKTGTAYPRRADRSFDYARGWGWYAGWAESRGRVLVFVRLTQTRERGAESPRVATRAGFLRDWPGLVGG